MFLTTFLFEFQKNVCRPPLTKAVSRSSVSSRGSPTDEAPAVPPTGSYSRGSSISGAPPPIPERTTPGKMFKFHSFIFKLFFNGNIFYLRLKLSNYCMVYLMYFYSKYLHLFRNLYIY